MVNEQELFAQGKLFFDAQKHDLAVPYFEKAIQLNPLVADYYEALGNAHSFIQDSDKYPHVIPLSNKYPEVNASMNVIPNWEDALLLDPNRLYLIAQIQNWKTMYTRPYYKEQVEYYSKMIRENPYSSDTHSSGTYSSSTIKGWYGSRANYYILLEDYERAINDLKKTDFFKGEYPSNLGIFYSKVKDYQQAKFYLDAAIKQGGKLSYDVFYERGLIHQMEGNSEAAIADFKKAIELGAFRAGPFLGLQQEQAKIKQKVEKKAREEHEQKQAKVNQEIAKEKEKQEREEAKIKQEAEKKERKEREKQAKLKQKMEKTEYYQTWPEEILSKVPKDALIAARNAIFPGGQLEVNKDAKLLQLIRERLAKTNNQSASFSSDDYKILSTALGKAVQGFMKHQATVNNVYHIHFKVKENQILQNSELSQAIDTAIASALSTISEINTKRPQELEFKPYKAPNEGLKIDEEKITNEGEQAKNLLSQIKQDYFKGKYSDIINNGNLITNLLTQQAQLIQFSCEHVYLYLALAQIRSTLYKQAWENLKLFLSIFNNHNVNEKVADLQSKLGACKEALKKYRTWQDVEKKPKKGIKKDSNDKALDELYEAIKTIEEILSEGMQKRASLTVTTPVAMKKALPPNPQTPRSQTGSLIPPPPPPPKGLTSTSKVSLQLKEAEERQQKPLQTMAVNKENKEERIKKELQRLRSEEEAKKKQEKQIGQNELSRRLQELKNTRKTNTMTASDLNQEYQELQSKALQLQSSAFFISRGEFYYESAEQETNVTRKETLYRKALTDYDQAMFYDPFLKGVPEQIDNIKSRLKELQLQNDNPRLFKSPPKQTMTKDNLPRREDLTPEQLKELERIKAELSKNM